MRFPEPGEVEYDDCYSPDGERILGLVTREVTDDGSVFLDAVHALVAARRRADGVTAPYRTPRVLMTTVRRWSGYSEYTITHTWSEVVLTVPDLELELVYESVPTLLRALEWATSDECSEDERDRRDRGAGLAHGGSDELLGRRETAAAS